MENLKIHPLEEDYAEAIELLGKLGYRTRDQIYSPQQYQHLIATKDGIVWQVNTAQFNDSSYKQVDIDWLRKMLSCIHEEPKAEAKTTYRLYITHNSREWLTDPKQITDAELKEWYKQIKASLGGHKSVQWFTINGQRKYFPRRWLVNMSVEVVRG